MAYKQNEMQKLLIATIAPANAVDRAIGKLEQSRQELAEYALSAMRSGALTLEAFREEMVTAWKSKLSKAKAKEVTALKHCGSTYAGIYYDIRRVHMAGSDIVARVVDKGEAITSVRRETNATQGKGKTAPKATNGNAKAKKLPTLAEAIGALNGYVTAAAADGDKALAMANNSSLAELISNIRKLEAAAVKAAKKAA